MTCEYSADSLHSWPLYLAQGIWWGDWEVDFLLLVCLLFYDNQKYFRFSTTILIFEIERISSLCLWWWFIFWACSFGYITLDDWLIDTLTVISFGYLIIGNIAYLVIKDEHSSQGILKFRTSIILWVFFLRVMVTVFIFISMSIGSFIMSAIYDGSYLVFFFSFSFFVAVLFSWIGLNTFLRKSYDNSIKDILSLWCKLDSISELLALEEQSIEILILSEMIHEKILFLVRVRYFLVPLSKK